VLAERLLNDEEENRQENHYFGPSFIKFLNDTYMPYTFLWASSTLVDLGIKYVSNFLCIL
jgi:hypothetical protein